MSSLQPTHVVFRSAHEADALAMQQIILDGRVASYAHQTPEFIPALKERLLGSDREKLAQKLASADKHDLFVVAEAEGRIVGLVTGHKHATGDALPTGAVVPVDGLAQLGSLYVVPEFQGRGVGTHLMDQFLDWSGGIPAGLVGAVANQPAIRFYQKFGFAITKEFDWQRGGEWAHLPLPCVWMERPADDLRIVLPDPADAKAIHAMHKASWRDTYPSPENGVSHEWVDDRLAAWSLERRKNELIDAQSNPKVYYRTAKQKNRVVGFVKAVIAEDGTHAELGAIYLDKTVHGTGLASRMMHGALRFLDNNHITETELEVIAYNKRAIRFYQKHGFEIVCDKTGEPILGYHAEVMPSYQMIRTNPTTKEGDTR